MYLMLASIRRYWDFQNFKCVWLALVLKIMQPIRLAMFCLLGVSFVLLPTAVMADRGDARFEEIKAQFLRLRNNDVDASDVPQWQGIARQFDEFSAKFSKNRWAPTALLNTAVVFELLNKNHPQGDYLPRARASLDRLIKRFPGDALVDDALLHKGDLALTEGNNAEATRYFNEILNNYKAADMYEVAEARLASIAGDKRPHQPESSDDGDDRRAATNNKGLVIVLDPGHGGEDFGAAGQGGLLEKDVTLAVALELEKLLTKELGAQVRLTRQSDVFVPLSERTAMANDAGAAIFVSLHNNASPKGKSSGLEVYYLDNTNDHGSKTLAERENKSLSFEGNGGGDLQFMLSDLIQNAKLDDSIRLAHKIEVGLLQGLSSQWKGTRGLGVKKAPFFVLVGAHMPCVLVEMFFINNADDGKRLAEKTFRQDLAQGLLSGIRSFIEIKR